jgi:hypothetical protein
MWSLSRIFIGEAMNTVSGKVFAVPTNLGIPNLIVVLYDLDPRAKPEELLLSLQGSGLSVPVSLDAKLDSRNDLGSLGDRIGSVLTSTDGGFLISFEDSEFKTLNSNEKRPDLFLMVLCPESPGKSLKDLILFTSPQVRQNAGKTETYLIQLDEALLKEKGVALPQQFTSNVPSKINNYVGKVAAAAKYEEAVLEVQREQISSRQREIKARKSEFKKLIHRNTPRDQGFTTFVQEGEQVADKLSEHIASETSRLNDRLTEHALVLNPTQN